MNTNTQHTPGPWEVDSLGGTTVWSADGEGLICDLDTGERGDLINTKGTRKRMVANARLIAAAPELFEALQELLAAHRKDGTITRQITAAGKARAAIAKATGAA